VNDKIQKYLYQFKITDMLYPATITSVATLKKSLCSTIRIDFFSTIYGHMDFGLLIKDGYWNAQFLSQFFSSYRAEDTG